MMREILVIFFGIIAFGSAIWGWWIDSRSKKRINKVKRKEFKFEEEYLKYIRN